MAACSNDFSPLVEQIWAFVVQDLELLAQAERAFTSAWVETRVLLNRAPGNAWCSPQVLDFPDFF